MRGDTPVKTVQNRQYIDNMSDYDSEHHRILKSVHHRLDIDNRFLRDFDNMHKSMEDRQIYDFL